MLEKTGAEVTVGDGMLALQEMLHGKSADRAFDVVLLDMQMPSLTAMALLGGLAAGCKVPIVALTASAMKGIARSVWKRAATIICRSQSTTSGCSK